MFCQRSVSTLFPSECHHSGSHSSVGWGCSLWDVDLLDVIVKEARRLLAPYSKWLALQVFGFGSKLCELKAALSFEDYDVQSKPLVVGIHGMAGTGKTTLAKLIHDEMMPIAPDLSWTHFSVGAKSDSKEEYQKKMQSMQLDFLQHLTGPVHVPACAMTVSNKLRNILKGPNSEASPKPRVLILDDIQTREQVQWLLGCEETGTIKEAIDALPLGSRVLLISRNQRAIDDVPSLNHHKIHLTGLNNESAEQLLSNASGVSLKEGQLEIALDFCGGLPSMLQAIGKQLRGAPDFQVHKATVLGTCTVLHEMHNDAIGEMMRGPSEHTAFSL